MSRRSRLGRLWDAQGGAAAIEYGLLGAIIGLGILAALVSTKTSLNGDFSRIAGQLGSAMASQGATTATPPPPPPITPTITPFASQFWGSKSVQSAVAGTNGGYPNYTVTYTDGSQAQLIKYTGQPYAYLLAIGDRTNYQIRYEYFDASNNVSYVQVNQYDSTMSQLQSVSVSQNGDFSAMAGNPPVGSSKSTTYYDGAGNATSTVNIAGSIYNTAAANSDGELAYFRNLSP